MEQVTIKNKNLLRHLAGIMMATVFFVFIIPSHGMALTPSGTVVGNQASATYNDSVGNQFTAQSNLFTITVSQVAGVSVSPQPGQSRSGAPANEVQFPHTVKNIGNGTDTFNLATVAGGAVTLNSITIIRDDNGNGIANPGEPAITSVTLDMDQSQMIVVRGTVPNSAANNTSGTVTLTATTTLTGSSANESSIDTVNVVTTAIISLAKSVSALTVNPNGTLDYTINYTNVGVTSTTGVAVTINGGASVDRHVVRDLIPTNTTFTSFLGTPTPAGGQTVFHVTNAGEHVYVTANPGAGLFDAVAYLFSTALTGGQSGVFSLQVTVNGTAQVGNITNTAVMHFNNGLGATSQSSNTTVSSVNLIPSVTIGDSTVATGNAGSVVSFTNLVTNNGNGADRFNITVVNGNFPSGTTFSFFNADGVTPLLDTNGDGIPDTGSMNAAATLDIIMKAAIPANASNTGAPFNATVTALSVASPFPSDTGTETLSAIVGPGVDLTVPATFSGDPGTTVSVVLNVHNTGPNPDSFNLQFSNAGGGSFSPGLLPSNMTAIQFFQGSSGSPTGAPLTSTGQLPAGTSTEIIARVTISTTGAGGATSTLFIRAVSVASGALDTESTLFTLNTIRGITLLQNQNGQASAGSATTYSHVLKNVGNVTESQINLAATNSQPGFLTTIYLDNDENGLINGADAVITSVTNLAAGASTFLIIRVAVPSSAANGAVDTMTLTATPTSSATAQSNIDQTTVVTGQVEMTISASPSGSQPPGQIITYTISFQNVGAAAVNSLLITDGIPVNTTYVPNSMSQTGFPPPLTLTDGSDSDMGTLVSGNKGSVQFNIGTLASGASGTVSFSVTID